MFGATFSSILTNKIARIISQMEIILEYHISISNHTEWGAISDYVQVIFEKIARQNCTS